MGKKKEGVCVWGGGGELSQFLLLQSPKIIDVLLLYICIVKVSFYIFPFFSCVIFIENYPFHFFTEFVNQVTCNGKATNVT